MVRMGIAVLVALPLLLLFHRSYSAAKRYSVPEDWSTQYDPAAFQEQEEFVPIIIGEPIQSDEGTFVLGYLYRESASSGDENEMIRRAPVLILQKHDVWIHHFDSDFVQYKRSLSIGNFTLDNVGGIELQESGNFIFYSTQNVTLWQSFDHPQQVILPNQRLRTGMKISSFNGKYSARMELDGLVFRRRGITYFKWPCAGTGESALFFNGTALSICSNAPPILVNASVFRLSNEGDLVGYNTLDGSWTRGEGTFNLIASSKGRCWLPEANFISDICFANGSCVSGPTYYTIVSSNCSLNTFTKMYTNISYSAIEFIDPVSASVNSCGQMCLDNCKCAIAFYNSTSQRCYIVEDTLVGNLMEDDGGMVFIAIYYVPMERRPNYPLPRLQIVAACTPLLLAGVIILLFWWRRTQAAAAWTLQVVATASAKLLYKLAIGAWPEDDSKEIEHVLAGARDQLPQRFSYSSLEAATDCFSESRKLGAGAFGTVYEGYEQKSDSEQQQPRHLAVKRLEAKHGVKQFVAEIASMASIGHMNVVRLYGFCIEASHRLLVYEFMPNGSLDRWLFHRKPEDEVLSWKQRLDIALGVARGLSYLHDECREPILHLDVKPQNILLDDRFVPKVGDFGLAKLLVNRDESRVDTDVRGTPGYIAPEWMLQATATKKCDVYSYGMVLLELVSGRRNLDFSKLSRLQSNDCSNVCRNVEEDDDSSWYFPAWAAKQFRSERILKLVDPNIVSSVQEGQLRRLVQIAFWCIQEKAHTRPAMQDIVKMLQGLTPVTDPPISFHFAVQSAIETAFPSAVDAASTIVVEPRT